MSEHFNDVYFSSGRYLLECGEWYTVHDYPVYSICKEGFIQKDGQILKTHKGDRQGHLNVRLRKDGKIKEEYVHRLVAKTFLRNPHNHPIVRHLDDDKDNNHVENLAWGTMKDNHKDSVRNGTYRAFSDEDREKSRQKTRTPIIATNLKTGEEKYFESQADAEREIKTCQGNISKVLNGERNHTMGYSFRYVKGGDKDD